MSVDAPEPTPETALYPAGHLESLALDTLIAERDRQRARENEALAQREIGAATEAAARARLCTQEMIRRRLAALAPTEPMQ